MVVGDAHDPTTAPLVIFHRAGAPVPIL
jgi:hypothetical protein